MELLELRESPLRICPLLFGVALRPWQAGKRGQCTDDHQARRQERPHSRARAERPQAFLDEDVEREAGHGQAFHNTVAHILVGVSVLAGAFGGQQQFLHHALASQGAIGISQCNLSDA